MLSLICTRALWDRGSAFLEQPNSVLQRFPPPQPSLEALSPLQMVDECFKEADDADITDFSERSFELRVALNFLAVRTGTVLEHEADAFDFAVQIFLISPQIVEPTRVSLPALQSGVLCTQAHI